MVEEPRFLPQSSSRAHYIRAFEASSLFLLGRALGDEVTRLVASPTRLGTLATGQRQRAANIGDRKARADALCKVFAVLDMEDAILTRYRAVATNPAQPLAAGLAADAASGLNNITDAAFFVDKLEECSHLHTSLMAEQEPLLLTTGKFNQNISDIDDNTRCLTNMITLNKDNLSKNTSDYNQKVSALKLKLKELDAKHIAETTLITATIVQDVAKIKTNAQTVQGIKSKIAIADDTIRMNQSKIDNLVETTKMYQSKLSAIELHAKNKQLELEAELEAGVKEEIARDV